VLFGGDLGQKQTLDAAFADEQAIAPHLDFLDVQDAAHGRKDGDFVLQAGQFAGRDGPEARVVQRRGAGHIAHRKIQRLDGRDVADTAAQTAAQMKRDERSPLVGQRLALGRRGVVSLPVANGGFHRLAGDPHQLVLLGLAQREVLLAGGAIGRGFQQGHGAVTHHAALIAGGVAAVGVLQQPGFGGSQPFGGHHGGDDGTSAAGFPYAQIEVARHAQVVPLPDGRQGLMIGLDRLFVGVVMRKVATGDDQGVRARD